MVEAGFPAILWRKHMKMSLRRSYSFVPIIVVLFLCITLLSGCSYWTNKRRQESTKKLTEFSDWIITRGIGEYYRTNDFNTIYNYIRARDGWFGYQGVVSHDYSYLAKVSILYLSYNAGLTCWQRINYHNMIYEYWTIGYTSKLPYNFFMRFVIVKAEALTMDREIIYETREFFKEYKIDDNITIGFPINNPNFVYDLRPWLYPDSFKGTELEGISEYDAIRKLKRSLRESKESQ